MNIKLRKKLHIIKKKLKGWWYFCMKPLAYAIRTYENHKYEKNTKILKNMSLDEVAKLYVKYIVKYMLKCKNSKEKYYCCTKKEGYSDYYEDNFILGDLNHFGYSRFSNTKLEGWFNNSPKCKCVSYGKDNKEQWINLENDIRSLVEKEFIRVGCTVEFVDESDLLDTMFMKQSGYEKTMIVTI